MTLSSFHNDCSKGVIGRREGGRRRWRTLAFLSLAASLWAGTGVAVHVAFAQTPVTPPSEPGQPAGQTQPQEQPQPQTAPPAPPEQQQLPPQQFLIQQPGRPPITPATPPSTTIPPWTPPVPPAPSQTNVPSPFPYTTPGALGVLPGAPGFVGGAPGLSIPGAFSPTTTILRGALLEFHPTARAALEYSDNFFQTTSRTEDNFRSILGPGFTVLLNSARTFGTVSTTVDLIHDTAPNSGDEVTVFPSLNAAIRYAFSPRLALTVADTFVRSDAPNVVDQFGIRRGRQIFDTNTASATVDWLLDQLALQAYYRNVLFINESGTANTTNGAADQDSVTHVLGVNASTRIAIDYLVRAGYEFSRTDTSGNSTTTTGNANADTTTHTGFVQASRQFGLYTTAGASTSYSFQTLDNTTIWNASLFGAYGLPSGLSLSGSVGYSILNSDIADNQGTVSANVAASYRFARSVVSAGVFRDFRQTAQQGQNFGTVETTSYFGSFLYQFTPFINLTLRATYSENAPTGTGNNQNNQTQNTLTYGASLNWQILRWLVASLQYSHTRQTGQGAFAQGSTGDFAENRASLSLFATF
jgi:hypothetical protein